MLGATEIFSPWRILDVLILLQMKCNSFIIQAWRNKRTKAWRNNINLHEPSKRKMGLPCFEKSWLLNDMKVPSYSVFLFMFFCLDPTVRKNIWMRKTSFTVMVIISNVLFWTLFRVGFFRTAHGCGAKKVPSLKSVTHILQWWNLAVVHYPKKI